MALRNLLNAELTRLYDSEPVCEILVDLNRAGIIMIGGLNPVAAAQEAGIESENHAMSVLIDYQKLVKVSEI